MPDSYDIKVTIMSQQGICQAGHRVGDEWIIRKDALSPQGMCISAYNAIHPYVMALMFGGSFPWESNTDVTRIACPDPDNPVIFKLERIH